MQSHLPDAVSNVDRTAQRYPSSPRSEAKSGSRVHHLRIETELTLPNPARTSPPAEGFSNLVE